MWNVKQNSSQQFFIDLKYATQVIDKTFFISPLDTALGFSYTQVVLSWRF